MKSEDWSFDVKNKLEEPYIYKDQNSLTYNESPTLSNLGVHRIGKSHISFTREPRSKKEAQLQLDNPTDNSHLLHATTHHAKARGHLWEKEAAKKKGEYFQSNILVGKFVHTTVLREKGGSQPKYNGKGIVTFEVHHGGRMVKSPNLNEWWFYVGGLVDFLDWCLLEYINLLEIYAYAKELGHHDQVVVTGKQNVAWSERGPIARNLIAEFEQSGYERMYEEDEKDEENEEDSIVVDKERTRVMKEEGDEGIIPEGTNVAEYRHEGTVLEGINVDEEGDESTVPDGINVEDETIYEEAENDKKAENESEDSKDPKFYDSTYEQSEAEQCLLEKDDREFDNYFDHNALDIDPAADE
ncbi:unnamed protein product [Prunus armeniaca]